MTPAQWFPSTTAAARILDATVEYLISIAAVWWVAFGVVLLLRFAVFLWGEYRT